MSEQELQRPVRTKVKVEPPITEPFQPQPIDLSSAQIAELLGRIVPSMGASPEPIGGEPEPLHVEEQYEISERRALSTSTTEVSYTVQTPGPKQVLVIAETQDHLVDFNQPTTNDSPKVFSSGSLSMTGKGVVKVYAKTVTGTGTIRIVVFKR